MSVFPLPPESRRAVNRAGKNIANGVGCDADTDIVDQWRAAHGYVLNTFKIFFRRRIEKWMPDAEFAQRLKRRRTVIDKLKRQKPDGSPVVADVTSMQDFAGCRLVFKDINDLEAFREIVNLPVSMENVHHVRRNDFNKYDYILNPKPSGYRGIHDVYSHFPRPHRRGEESSKPWHGLLVEVQYRTKVQHAWATALEISDIIDGERTKFDMIETERFKFFAIASEILARHYEKLQHAFVDDTTKSLQEEFRYLEAKLSILQRLQALKEFGGVDKIRKHNVLNIFRREDDSLGLDVLNFRSAGDAIERSKQLEKDPSSVNAVYVRSDNRNQLRSVYRNYFNDTEDFVKLVNAALG